MKIQYHRRVPEYLAALLCCGLLQSRSLAANAGFRYSGGAGVRGSYAFRDCDGIPKEVINDRNSGATSDTALVDATAICAGTVGVARATQTGGGNSALFASFHKRAQIGSPDFQAVAHYHLTVENITAVAVPLRLVFTIYPGSIRLLDGTADGIGIGGQTGLAQFNIVTTRFFPTHPREKWTWVETLSGGRLGITNSSARFDPQGIGVPALATNYSGGSFELSYDEFTGALELDALNPGETVGIDYTIIVQATGDGSFREADNGVTIEAGDPVQVESGEPSSAGSRILAMGGDTVFGSPRLVPVSGPRIDGDQFSFSFDASSNRTYAVDFRPTLEDDAWRVLTNFPALAAPALRSVAKQVGAAAGYYRVRTP